MESSEGNQLKESRGTIVEAASIEDPKYKL